MRFFHLIKLATLKFEKMVKGRGKDVYQRINFLYQAANTLLKINPSNVKLIRFYGHTIIMIAKKTQIKLDPSIKRTICKKCHVILFPGITATTRLKSKRTKHCVVTCVLCKTVKRFLTKAGYELWYNKAKSQTSVEYLGKRNQE